MSRTMVKVRAISGSLLSFQVINLESGASPQFFLPVEECERLDLEGQLHADSMTDWKHPFSHHAEFFWVTSLRQLHICFFWRNSFDRSGFVREDHVRLSYDDFAAFVDESKWDGAPVEWKCLSLEESHSPRLVFLEKRNLRQCLAAKAVRRKLVRYLRDRFACLAVREIQFRDSAIPYSFTYQEICDTAVRTVGSVLLFRQDDLERAYYHIRSRKESNPARPEYCVNLESYLNDRWNLQ